MKKYAIFMFAALVMFASTMKAQENKEKKAKGPSIEVRVEKMATDLGLTDAEKATVKTLLEKQDAEKKEFSKSMDKENAEYKPKMKELQKKHAAELKAAIGDEKFKKMQDLKAAEKAAEKKAE
jgi:Skp family chaperone for outer membrane proteins